MKYIFYKTDGKITQHHPAPKGWTDEQLDESMKKFNSAVHEHFKKTAFVLEVQEGSVEAYLLECLDKKYRYERDTLQEAKDAVLHALDCLNGLEFVEDERDE